MILEEPQVNGAQMKGYNVRLTDEQVVGLRAEARKLRRKYTGLIRIAVDEFLARQERGKFL